MLKTQPIRPTLPTDAEGQAVTDLHIRVTQCFVQAELFFQRSFLRPSLALTLKGQRAGVAHLQENHLRFNATLYAQNTEDFLTQTVAHEVAHLIAYQVYGAQIRPHGSQWQAIMQNVYGLAAKRCHTYVLPQSTKRCFIYHCACQDHEFTFSTRRHSLVQQGRRYLCKICKSSLRFSGQALQQHV